jgi:hypothetical protein
VVTIPQGEFAGDPASLVAYREQLTPNEVRHLLCKYALCGTPTLYEIGVTQGRTALINALFDYESAPQTASERAQTEQRLGGLAVEDFALSTAYEARGTNPCGPSATHSWTVGSAQSYWLSRLLNDNPLRENVGLLLSQHIPVNFGVTSDTGVGGGCSGNWTFKGYIDLMRTHALGRPPQTPEERPVTSSYRGFLTDLLEDYQMGLYLNHLQPRVHVPPPGYNYWHVGFHNSNFGREIMQVFSLGQFNVYTGRRNYTDNDVRAVSESLAGHVNEFAQRLNQVPALKRTPWRLFPAINEGRWAEWSPTLRQVGTKTIFENEAPPVRKSGDLTPPDVIDSIVAHQGLAYVPRRIFSSSVYPLAAAQSPMTAADPGYQALLGQLDSTFRVNDLRMRDFYRVLMNSSASFSQRARFGCIANGAVHLLRLIRTLQLPVTNTRSDDTQSIKSTYYQILDQLMPSMNDSIGLAPSIFGYNECGDTDGTPEEFNYGQKQLMTQEMLGRFNMPFELMLFYTEGNVWWWDVKRPQEGFDPRRLLPPGVPNPTAAQIVAHFENLFGVTLSASERGAIMRFLDPTTGTRPRWSTTASLPANPYLPNQPRKTIMEARLPLLVSIFSNLPDVNVR